MRTKELYERMLSHGYMGRADDGIPDLEITTQDSAVITIFN